MSRRTICYFFFKDDFDDQKTSLSALCSLAHQIFCSNPDVLANDILERYETRGEKLVESFEDLWGVLLSAASNQETVFVIDALDESPEDDRNRLIKAMTAVSPGSNDATKRPRPKFFLTSRPYEQIRRQIFLGSGSQTASIHLQGDLGTAAEDIVQEIQLVVDNRIDETAECLGLDLDERNLFRAQLESIPNRTYLWITLVFDGLVGSGLGISKRDILEISKSLPQSVEDAYERILNRSQDKDRTRRALHIILGAMRPLTIPEISVSLAIESSKDTCHHIANNIIPANRIRNHIRQLCGLFVTVVDDRVYLLHQTAREFLVRNITEDPGSYIWKYSMNPADSNSVLAKICISYLHSGFAKENDSLLEYSAIYWPDHYHQSRGNCQEEVAEMTRDICLPSSCTQWTEVRGNRIPIPVTGPPLCLASALGLNRAVEMLLHDQDSTSIALMHEINSRDNDGRTPLLWAAARGHEAVVRLLLDTGKADIDSKDRAGLTPLWWAAARGHEAIVKVLESFSSL
jgi:hypothetical protein